jgi:hypothetical protein
MCSNCAGDYENSDMTVGAEAADVEREELCVPDEFDENFCLHCGDEIPHGREFCGFECQQIYYGQQRAERKLRP